METELTETLRLLKQYRAYFVMQCRYDVIVHLGVSHQLPKNATSR